MLIRFGYDFELSCAQETPLVCLVSPRPERTADLSSIEPVKTAPAVPVSRYLDSFGNSCLRMVAPAGTFRISQSAVIRDTGQPDPWLPDLRQADAAKLPAETLAFLLPSRYVESDLLSDTAWQLFGGVDPGWARVQAICDHVHGHITFGYNTARSTRTAFGAWTERQGVCRDFAHLALAFCRAMNIPARYVNGYLGDIGVPVTEPMDFAAWIEVWLEDRWVTFDPRNNARRIGRIKVAHGRDAADVPLIHSFGTHILQGFKVVCEEISEAEATLQMLKSVDGHAA